MYKKLKDFFLKRQGPLLVVYSIVVLIATLQEYNGGPKRFPTQKNDNDYTYYNNYVIFKQSFTHLINGSNLYTLHLSEHWDLYKYSPTFALFFGLFAWLPDFVGLLLWNSLNGILLVLAIRMLPQLNSENKNYILLFSVVELFTTLQNAQSNGLIAALILMAFALLEKNNFFWGCFLIALTVYIKLFGLFAFAVCLLYPQRLKMVGYSILSMVGLAILPSLVVKMPHLLSIYENWWHLLQSDYAPNPLSFVGVIKIWTGLSLNQNLVLILGIALFITPFSRIKFYSHFYFRLAVLSMILIWMIVFNHKAESPTFIIAVVGIGIWYYASGLSARFKTSLLFLTLIFTSLSPTDLFPDVIQDNYFVPLAVKSAPCIVIYFVAFYELTFNPNLLSSK